MANIANMAKKFSLLRAIARAAAVVASLSAIAASDAPAFNGPYPTLSVALAAETYEMHDETRTLPGSRTVRLQWATIDPKDPSLDVAPVIAAGGIGRDEPFAAIVARENAVVAVNGTFFNAYDKRDDARYPNGLLYRSGELLYSGVNTALILTADKRPVIRRVAAGVSVTVGTGPNAYTFQPWGVNKDYGDNDDQVVWYTPAFGRTVDFPGSVKAVVRAGKIERLTDAAVTVPADGFVVRIGPSANNRANLLPHLHVGDPVSFRWTAADADTGEPLDVGRWLAAIGAGPKLLSGGAVDLDPKRDGFSDPKITEASGARTFAAVDARGRLMLGTASRATLAELARLLVAIGAKEAMNLDGGASSAFYANGTIRTAPGRNLSNALVVRKLAAPAVQLVIDGRFVPEFRGFIRENATLVPVRPFITALNTEFRWIGETRTAVVRKNGTELRLSAGVPEAVIDGRKVAVVPPPDIVDGRMYAPLRTVAEAWKADVEWNAELYRVSVRISDKNGGNAP